MDINDDDDEDDDDDYDYVYDYTKKNELITTNVINVKIKIIILKISEVHEGETNGNDHKFIFASTATTLNNLTQISLGLLCLHSLNLSSCEKRISYRDEKKICPFLFVFYHCKTI